MTAGLGSTELVPVELSTQDVSGVGLAAVSVSADAQALLLAALPDNPDAELSVVLCSDAHIRQLNAAWRSNDSATDVLSFPQEHPVVLGDLVISLDTAGRQASERGWTAQTELRILLVHGLLHLLGYDHETGADDFAEMAAAERRLLDRLGWAGSGLVEQATDEGDTAPTSEEKP